MTNFRLMKMGWALAALVLAGVLMPMAQAADNAGTTVQNDVQVQWGPSGNERTDTDSSTFRVDLYVTFTVEQTDDAAVTVSEGDIASGADVLHFAVTNNSNNEITYNVSASNSSVGNGNMDFDPGADTVDVSGFNVYLDDGDTPGSLDGSDTLVTDITLAEGASASLLVTATAPAPATDGDIAHASLTVEAADSALSIEDLTNLSNGADLSDIGDGTEVQVVFNEDTDADSPNTTANDGIAGATSAFRIGVATVTVTKANTIVEDPLNGTSNPEFEVPGSVIEYTITVTFSSGSGQAQGIGITDSYDQTNTAIATGAYSGEDLQVSGDQAFTCTLDTGPGDGDECHTDSGTGDIVVELADMENGDSVNIQYRVTIQ